MCSSCVGTGQACVWLVGDGECYNSSVNSHRMYHKDGKAEDCTDDLIGGVQSVCVYALTGKKHNIYVDSIFLKSTQAQDVKESISDESAW